MTTDAPIKSPIADQKGITPKVWANWFRQVTSVLASGLFSSIIVSDLTPNRIVSTDSDRKLVSIEDLTAWLDSTANEVEVIDNGDGTVTLGLPDDVLITDTLTVNGNTCLKADSKLYFDN